MLDNPCLRYKPYRTLNKSLWEVWPLNLHLLPKSLMEKLCSTTLVFGKAFMEGQVFEVEYLAKKPYGKLCSATLVLSESLGTSFMESWAFEVESLAKHTMEDTCKTTLVVGKSMWKSYDSTTLVLSKSLMGSLAFKFECLADKLIENVMFDNPCPWEDNEGKPSLWSLSLCEEA